MADFRQCFANVGHVAAGHNQFESLRKIRKTRDSAKKFRPLFVIFRVTFIERIDDGHKRQVLLVRNGFE